MLTATEIANLTDDELTALNKELTHKLGKKIAIQIAVRVGVALTVHYAASAIIKKLDSKQEQDSK